MCNGVVARDQKLKFLTYAPVAVAPFSLLGSLLTLFTIYRIRADGSHDHNKLFTHHRLIVGVSITDVIFSLAAAVGPLPLPRDLYYELPGVRKTHGTMNTCQTQAFMLNCGTGAYFYNTCLMLYYVLVIRYGVRDRVIHRRIEPFMHVISVGYVLATSIAGVALEVFNPYSGVCWIAPNPIHCGLAGVECERGENAESFRLWLATVPRLATTSLMILLLLVLGLTVWWRNLKRKRFVFEKGLGYASPNDTMDRRAQIVISQSLLYGITMTNSVFWSSIMQIIDIREGTASGSSLRLFWVTAIGWVALNFQGFFNFLIFIRPRYMAIRSGADPAPSRFAALVESVMHPIGSTNSKKRVRADRDAVSAVRKEGHAVGESNTTVEGSAPEGQTANEGSKSDNSNQPIEESMELVIVDENRKTEDSRDVDSNAVRSESLVKEAED